MWNNHPLVTLAPGARLVMLTNPAFSVETAR